MAKRWGAEFRSHALREISIRETLHRLITWKLPPLPVAPASVQQPKKFTGKNPSYLNSRGARYLVQHKLFQSRMPSDQEIKNWFANPLNGIGTLGGWHNIIWLDFDSKRFQSIAECDRRIEGWLIAHHLEDTFIERTHSGGWRIGVRVHTVPCFTNFSLERAGDRHIGEALGKGRFTVLAPTIGKSGNPYRSINRAYPIEVESLESIGIYPWKASSPSAGLEVFVLPKSNVSPAVNPCFPKKHRDQSSQAFRPNLEQKRGKLELPLVKLLSKSAYYILTHVDTYRTGDRSDALILLAREAFGWETWAATNGHYLKPSARELCYQTGQALGLSCDRIERILACKESKPLKDCAPAIYRYQGDTGCWLKVLSIF